MKPLPAKDIGVQSIRELHLVSKEHRQPRLCEYTTQLARAHRACRIIIIVTVAAIASLGTSVIACKCR